MIGEESSTFHMKLRSRKRKDYAGYKFRAFTETEGWAKTTEERREYQMHWWCVLPARESINGDWRQWEKGGQSLRTRDECTSGDEITRRTTRRKIRFLQAKTVKTSFSIKGWRNWKVDFVNLVFFVVWLRNWSDRLVKGYWRFHCKLVISIIESD